MNAIERSKENIQPLIHGRAAGRLTQIIEEGSFEERREQEREEYEAWLASLEEGNDDVGGEDPIQVWIDYILWIEENYRSMMERNSKMDEVLKRCLITFEHDDRYKNDERYMRIWVRFIWSSSEPLEILKHMMNNGIGESVGLFYETYAHFLEIWKKYDDAEKIYELGVQRNVTNADQLKDKQLQFRMRVAATKGTLEAASETAIPRPTFGELLSRGENGNLMSMQNSGRQNSKKEKVKVFKDKKTPVRSIWTDTKSQKGVKTANPVEMCAVQANENIQQPSKWTEFSLKVKKKPSTQRAGKFEVFKDSKPSDSDPKRENRTRNKDRPAGNARQGYDISLIEDENGNEMQFEEARAMRYHSRGGERTGSNFHGSENIPFKSEAFLSDEEEESEHQSKPLRRDTPTSCTTLAKESVLSMFTNPLRNGAVLEKEEPQSSSGVPRVEPFQDLELIMDNEYDKKAEDSENTPPSVHSLSKPDFQTVGKEPLADVTEEIREFEQMDEGRENEAVWLENGTGSFEEGTKRRKQIPETPLLKPDLSLLQFEIHEDEDEQSHPNSLSPILEEPEEPHIHGYNELHPTASENSVNEGTVECFEYNAKDFRDTELSKALSRLNKKAAVEPTKISLEDFEEGNCLDMGSAMAYVEKQHSKGVGWTKWIVIDIATSNLLNDSPSFSLKAGSGRSGLWEFCMLDKLYRCLESDDVQLRHFSRITKCLWNEEKDMSIVVETTGVEIGSGLSLQILLERLESLDSKEEERPRLSELVVMYYVIDILRTLEILFAQVGIVHLDFSLAKIYVDPPQDFTTTSVITQTFETTTALRSMKWSRRRNGIWAKSSVYLGDFEEALDSSILPNNELAFTKGSCFTPGTVADTCPHIQRGDVSIFQPDCYGAASAIYKLLTSRSKSKLPLKVQYDSFLVDEDAISESSAGSSEVFDERSICGFWTDFVLNPLLNVSNTATGELVSSEIAKIREVLEFRLEDMEGHTEGSLLMHLAKQPILLYSQSEI